MKHWTVIIVACLVTACFRQTGAFYDELERTFDFTGDVTLSREKRNPTIGSSQGQIPTVGRRSRIVLPTVPFDNEYLEKSRMIFHAHQILFGPLFEYFKGSRTDILPTEDLNNVLNQFKNHYSQHFNLNTAPRNLRDHFYQIYHQRNEVCHQSYSIACFDLDKEVLFDVARYLAAQSSVSNRNTLIQNITNALNYRGPSTSRTPGIVCSRYSTDNLGNINSRADRTNSRSNTRRNSRVPF